MSEQQQAGGGKVVTEGPSLIDQALAETKMKTGDDGYDVAKKGVEEFIKQMLAPKKAGEKVDKSALEGMIAEIDRKLSVQVNEILHHVEFQKMESAWRGLKYMVDRFDFRQNIQLEFLNATKDDLIANFDDNELTKSALYQTVYSSEYGTYGGSPYGMMVGNYDFNAGPQDMTLLANCAKVAAVAHAPFITNASHAFFRKDSFEELPTINDIGSVFSTDAGYARWRSFRDSEDARYVGMCMPRFMLRLPYGPDMTPVKTFNFVEDVVDQHDKYLWGYASAAFATRVAESFAKYRWCPNIIGPQAGGTVDDLPLHQYQQHGELITKTPTENVITERQEYEFSEEGFIALTWRKDSNNAAFFSASSAQKPLKKQDKNAERDYKLGTQLPYTFVITRLAHYLKVMQREQIGTWKSAQDLQRELTTWIKQYISDQPDPHPTVRSRRPLRAAEITVEDVPGDAGWYSCSIKVAPHFKYMGASFTLSLVGKMAKDK